MKSIRALLASPAGRWGALVAWCLLIFALSAQPDLRFADDSTLDLVLRKLGHAMVFGTLALLASMTFASEGLAATRALAAAFVFTVLYAISDEWHQSFVAGRQGTARDVAIDTTGAVIALSAAWMLRRKRDRASARDI
jgi:VanZ family protein